MCSRWYVLLLPYSEQDAHASSTATSNCCLISRHISYLQLRICEYSPSFNIQSHSYIPFLYLRLKTWMTTTSHGAPPVPRNLAPEDTLHVLHRWTIILSIHRIPRDFERRIINQACTFTVTLYCNILLHFLRLVLYVRDFYMLFVFHIQTNCHYLKRKRIMKNRYLH